MSRVKDIRLKVIPSKVAKEFIKKHHYSGKIASTGEIYFGAFLEKKLVGAIQLGRSINKRKMIGLVTNTRWNGFLELNRLVLLDYVPKNSESRIISVMIRLLKKHAPHIKWIISFADGTQCGDGTIYRASGFKLTGIVKNKAIVELPNGEKHHHLTWGAGQYGRKRKEMLSAGFNNWKKYLDYKYDGWKLLDGFQLRYIYLIDKTCKITVPILPFSKIDEMGAGMYKGKKKCDSGVNRSTPSFQDGGGGAEPTESLYNYA